MTNLRSGTLSWLVLMVVVGWLTKPAWSAAGPAGVMAEADSKPRLMLWLKADDLAATLKDGERVSNWPDASGRLNDATSQGMERATFRAAAMGTLPGVVFANRPAAQPKEPEHLTVPLRGEWRGTTIFVVGTNLAQGSWFGSSFGSSQELRVCNGFIQQCGTSAAFAGFPDRKGQSGPQVICLTSDIDPQGQAILSAYCDGKPSATATDPAPKDGVMRDGGVMFGIFNPARLGGYGPEGRYEGAIGEVLIYQGVLSAADRAVTEGYLLARYGMAGAPANAPAAPFGYVPPAPATPPLLPDAAAKPCLEGLELWAAAEDIAATNGANILTWPTRSGDKKPITALKDHPSTLVMNSINGRAVARFTADAQANPRQFAAVEIPLAGARQELTMVFVGRRLNGAGLFDTAPCSVQTLRGSLAMAQHCSSPQLTGEGSRLIDQTSPWIGVVTVGKNGDAGQYLAFHLQGYPQGRVEDKTKVIDVLFKNPILGVINYQEAAFNGDLAEVLIYHRALSDAQRYQTERYLADKYALPLNAPAEIAKGFTPRTPWSFRLPQLPRQFTWLGNSESGKDSAVQHGIFTICSLPDGRVAAISVWDEPHKEIGLYKDGQSCKEGKTALGTSGGGGMIVTDGKYFYAGVTPGTGREVAVRRLSLDLKEQPWPDAPKGRIAFATNGDWQEIDGLAVIGRELFITCQKAEGIRVHDVDTGTFKRELAVAAHGRLCGDPSGMLWAAAADGAVQMDVNGQLTGRKITGVKVGGLAINPKGQLLLADNGQRQQVIIYDISGNQPQEVAAIGQRGGIYAAKGIMSDDRLLEPNGVGADAQGNVSVSGGWRIMNYSPNGQFRWKTVCTHFCIVGDFDPQTDGNDLYTKNFHYAYVPGNPPGQDWQWQGYTADPTRFGELADGMQYTQLHRFNGTLYRITLNDGQWGVVWSRQEPGSEFFIPCAVVQLNRDSKPRLQNAPKAGPYIWTDLNGNGLAEKEEIVGGPAPASNEWSAFLFVDSQGGVWQPQGRKGMRYLPLKGFNGSGAPIYDWADERLVPRPSEFTEVRRALYYPETDTMYLAGYTWENPQVPSEWVTAGCEIIRYDNWSKPSRKATCRIPFSPAVTISCFDVVPGRDLLFAGDLSTSVVFAYNTKTGKFLGMFEPDPAQMGFSYGWLDFPGGDIHAFARRNGEIVISLEECYNEKELIFRLPPGFEGKTP